MSKPADLRKTPKIPFDLLREMNPNWKDSMLELSKLMTDEMLRSIAAADYGYKEEECFILLKEIIRTQALTLEIDYALMECLELTRWLEPENDTEHKCRAFSCVLLVIFSGEMDYTPISDENETLVSLIESVAELNYAQQSTQGLMAWRILADYKVELNFYLEDEEDKDYIDEITIDPFFIYALLLLLLLNAETDILINQVLEWSVDMEKDLKGIPPYDTVYQTENMTIERKAQPFLLGTTNFNQCHHLWQSLSKNALGFIKQYKNPMLRKVLTAVGTNKPVHF